MNKLKIPVQKTIVETIYLPKDSEIITNDSDDFTAIRVLKENNGISIMTFTTDSLIDDADYDFEDYGTLFLRDCELATILKTIKSHKADFPETVKLLK